MPKDDRPEDDADTVADDQREHSYYYDDSHGYQKYDPAAEEDEEESENAERDELVGPLLPPLLEMKKVL